MSAINFTTWFLGRNPSKEIIVTGYNQDLPEKHSKAAREIMDSDIYKTIFDTRLNPKSSGISEWHTDKWGCYKAV